MVENIEKKMNGSLTQKFIYYSAVGFNLVVRLKFHCQVSILPSDF